MIILLENIIMKQKVFIVLALFYSIQLFIACCPDETYDYTIVDVDSRLLVLNDNQFVEVTEQDTINKEDLLISIQMEIDEVLVSEVWNELNKIGVQSSYASIDCFGPTINYVNSIQNIEVFAVDENNAEVEVSDDLLVQEVDTTIAEFLSFADSVSFQESFTLVFSDVTNLSTEATFRIRVSLSNNVIVETVTNKVNFN